MIRSCLGEKRDVVAMANRLNISTCQLMSTLNASAFSVLNKIKILGQHLH